MATVVSQHVYHFGCHLGFFKNVIFSRIAGNFLEYGSKHVFTASSIIKNRVEGKNWDKFCQKNYRFFNSNINLHNEFCTVISDGVIQLNVKRCVHNWTTGAESFIFIASKLQFLDLKNLVGQLPPPSPLAV